MGGYGFSTPMLCLLNGNEVSRPTLVNNVTSSYDHGLRVSAPLLSTYNDGEGLTTIFSPHLGGMIAMDTVSDADSLATFSRIEQWIEGQIALGKDPTVILNVSNHTAPDAYPLTSAKIQELIDSGHLILFGSIPNIDDPDDAVWPATELGIPIGGIQPED